MASEQLINARTYLERVLPWPTLGAGGAYVNIHYPSANVDPNGKRHWNGVAVEAVEEALEQIRLIMASSTALGDIYVCMSSQSVAETRNVDGRVVRSAKRSQKSAVALRSIYLDIDVKPGAYQETPAANRALVDFCRAAGLPRPSIVTHSGSGGLHVYWTFDEALAPAQWQPIADALAAATRQHGLICDTAVTVDSARLLRVPDTFNFKTTPPGPVTMASKPGPDYSPGKLAAVLRATMPQGGATNSSALNSTSGASSHTAVPIILATARASCGFLEEAFATGGKAFNEPLWHLSVLASTFDEGGLKTAHLISRGHPGYDPAETVARYERKRMERETKSLGWPSCRAIENAGCRHCATCAVRDMTKSPLNLADRVSYDAPVPSPALRASPISDIPLSPPPRRWIHGTDLMKGVCTLLVSPGGKGKTALLIGIALACASGRSLMGAKVYGGKHRVLYLNTEDGLEEIGRRTRAALRHHKLTDADVDGLRLAGVDTARLTLLASQKSNHRINNEALAQFRALIGKHRPSVIILDPLANLSAHTLNDNAAATELMATLTSIAVEYDAAVLIAHHTGKGRDLASQEAAMGASALVNSARAVLSIETLMPGDAGKVGVMPSDAPRYFRLTGVKGNLSPPSSEDRWYELTSVHLNNGTPEYPSGDNVQVVAPFTPSPAANVFPPSDIITALTAIASASPPLSMKKQARDRYAPTVLAGNLGLSGTTAELNVKALIDSLLSRHLITEEYIKITRGGGRGPQERLGLAITNAGRALANLNPSAAQTPQSPQSALSQTGANHGEAARLALLGDASVALGGTGGIEAGDRNQAAGLAD
jgi:hypothetical protein